MPLLSDLRITQILISHFTDESVRRTMQSLATSKHSQRRSIMSGTALASIVLVHGGFVDGSGWDEVYKILRKDGYPVSIVQNPTTSLADDVAATRRVIAEQKAPVVLVGHSYGGAVITEAGTDPAV